MSKNSNSDDGDLLKGLTLTPALTALFMPTAKYLGEEIRDTVKGQIQIWKSKRQAENLETHIKEVKRRVAKRKGAQLTKSEEPSLRTANAVSEGVESVQDVDPQDKELSELWQGLLAAAVMGEDIPSVMLQTLKTLSPEEAACLLGFRRRRNSVKSQLLFAPLALVIASVPVWFLSGIGKDRYLVRSLEAKGLIEKNWWLTSILCLGLLGMALYPVWIYNNWDYIFDTSNFGRALSDVAGRTLYFLTIALVAALGLPFPFRRLSWLGWRLSEYADTNEKHHSPHG